MTDLSLSETSEGVCSVGFWRHNCELLYRLPHNNSYVLCLFDAPFGFHDLVKHTVCTGSLLCAAECPWRVAGSTSQAFTWLPEIVFMLYVLRVASYVSDESHSKIRGCL